MAKTLGDACEEIYQAYPKKVGKKAALVRISQALAIEPFKDLLAGTKAYCEAVAHLKGTPDWRLVPLPATWFHQERWKDSDDDRPTSIKLRTNLARVSAKPGKYRNVPVIRPPE
jgi:hypothetical protein